MRVRGELTTALLALTLQRAIPLAIGSPFSGHSASAGGVTPFASDEPRRLWSQFIVAIVGTCGSSSIV